MFVERPVYIENIIEKPVPYEKVIEKEVEIPVEHIVEKPVFIDNIIKNQPMRAKNQTHNHINSNQKIIKS